LEDLYHLGCGIRQCLDESTDVTLQASLAVFVRFPCGNVMREELVKLLRLPTTTTGKDIMNEVKQELVVKMGVDLQKIVSVTTEAVPSTVGIHNGFVKFLREEVQHPLVQFHCILHQEALCAKASMNSFESVLSVVTKIVNFISARALNNRQFSKMLQEVGSQYGGLLRYNNVRWLSCGQVLQRFVELLDEIRFFITEKQQEFPELTDAIWLCDLMFFRDFTALYNDLNKELQGKGHTANILFEIIKS
jgi:hypothetical protein